MKSSEVADQLIRLIGRLSTDDLAMIVEQLGGVKSLNWPSALRYQAWNAIEDARDDPMRLLAVANPVLAKVIGWEGSPLLSLEDVHV
ncbi:MAG: hypothetical protein M0Z36_02405 [Thermaerobacter sp.]|nr:hypothetical protein [Thermaerobacter sp.]